MEDSTNVNEFESPGPNGDRSVAKRLEILHDQVQIFLKKKKNVLRGPIICANTARKKLNGRKYNCQLVNRSM
jgi:hypothetical protein